MPNEIRPIDAVALKNDISGELQQIEAIAYMSLRNDVSRMSQAINAAIDTAPTLDYAPVNRWISEKNPPKKDGRYWTRISCDVGCWYEENTYNVKDSKWIHEWAHDGSTEDATPWVTHWMPLPEPPKEEV